jgi:hypothetical protein
MPGLPVRDFKCTIYQGSFTMMSGDLIVPEPDLCVIVFLPKICEDRLKIRLVVS